MKTRNNFMPHGAFTALIFALLCWQLIHIAGVVPPYMLPSPLEVFTALVKDFPLLTRHIRVTLFEAGAGLALAVAAACLFALCMDLSAFVKKTASPLLLLTQTVPSIALAPLLVLWLGYGAAPKIALVFITCFFPVTVALADAFANTDVDAVRLLRSMGARHLQIYRYLKLPQALPPFFSGLKIAASYAVAGAVISEWLGGNSGLGVYMTRVRKSYSFDKMFAVILITALLSVALLKAVSLLEWLAMPWKRNSLSEKITEKNKINKIIEEF
ncbi:MAG: ABC transporter permease [Spirochaetaceae bacterium]|jgi:ABC-type nitrate/sulfonate/bicarbonate transport system permease component|nr:ABC transporter permease [Spirochaetaceae bacterium]